LPCRREIAGRAPPQRRPVQSQHSPCSARWKGINVGCTPGAKGEKREEKEEKKKDYYVSERRYGSFQRSFTVPAGVDVENVEAQFKNGILTVNMAKSAQAQKNEKKIEIKKAAA
jgi:HSP20 family protein